MDITITLTNEEALAMQYVAESPAAWATNFVKNRARIGADEIVSKTVEHCLSNNLSIPATREEIIQFAYDNGVVLTVEQNNAQLLAMSPSADQPPA